MDSTYECTCAGHTSGSRSFTAAEPSWWAQKGMSTPKSCPDCRAWIKGRTDRSFSCTVCGKNTIHRAQFQISWHKRTGPYDDKMNKCLPCQLSGRRASTPVRAKPGVKLVSLPNAVKRAQAKIPMASFTDIADYDRDYPNPKKHPNGYRLGHWAKHILGHPLSETNSGASPTTLVSAGSDQRDFYAAFCKVAETLSTGTLPVYEFAGSRGKIIRLTPLGPRHFELTIFEPLTDKQSGQHVLDNSGNVQYECTSSFDNVDQQYIGDQQDVHRWY